MSPVIKDFVSDLKKKQERSAELQDSIEKHVKEWQDNVVSFYDQIKKWLKPLEDENLIDLIEKDIDISEELATYKTKELNITIHANKRIIKFVPKGTWIIGANGRIDLDAGFINPVKFVLVSEKATSAGDLIQVKISTESETSREEQKDIKFVWKVFPSDVSRGRFETLTEDMFIDIIKQVAL